ncbi:MAG: class I SAM-dependent methyltransferase [Candidatus Thorarchaeota archaeon]
MSKAEDVINSIRSHTHGGLSRRECLELYRQVKLHKPMNVLEVGHFRGLSTNIILSALPVGARMLTIDHHKGDKHTPESNPSVFFNNIYKHARPTEVSLEVCIAAFEDIEILNAQKCFDFVFYDAAHNASTCAAFWSWAKPVMRDNCLLLFDDANLEVEMGTLTTLAKEGLFKDITSLPIESRGTPKFASETYSIMVMQRECK